MRTPWRLLHRSLFAKAVFAGCALLHSTNSFAAGLVFLPTTGGYDPQLGGAYLPPAGVQTVSRDRLSPPAAGLYSICYFNAFQTQAEETAWWTLHHADLLLRGQDGKFVEDPNWPGEFLLDTSIGEKRQMILDVIDPWITKCAEDGFNAIEPDNLDSWTRSSGLLEMNDNLAMARLISDRAHNLGLAVAQKNNPEIGAAGKSLGGFDFAIAEECEVNDECEDYTSVYGQVLEIEYIDNSRKFFTLACSKRSGQIPIVYRDRGLVTPGEPNYHFEMC